MLDCSLSLRALPGGVGAGKGYARLIFEAFSVGRCRKERVKFRELLRNDEPDGLEIDAEIMMDDDISLQSSSKGSGDTPPEPVREPVRTPLR